MPNLPINISSVPVKVAASRQSGNIDAAQQDAQNFGNVLSRKVTDSAKPAEPPPQSSRSSLSSESPHPAGPVRSNEVRPQQNGEQENTETAPIEEEASALPAEMLATLLAQQNQSGTPQTDTGTQSDNSSQSGITPQPALNFQAGFNIQPPQNSQISASSPKTAGKDAGTSLVLISANGQAANSNAPALEAVFPQISNSAQKSINFAETFKALGMKETATTASNQSLLTSAAGELPVSAPQNLALPLAPAATSPSSPTTISTALTQPAWGDEFSQKITWMATQRNQSAELHLNPPQLGPLDVVLKMNGDQASAIFTSPHAAVREAIEQALPKLREMLADSGIMLGNAMVSDHSAKNNQDNSSPKATGGIPSSSPNDTTEGGNIQEVRVSSRSHHNGMVDTFA